MLVLVSPVPVLPEGSGVLVLACMAVLVLACMAVLVLALQLLGPPRPEASPV
jgi:hypothetical protein